MLFILALAVIFAGRILASKGVGDDMTTFSVYEEGLMETDSTIHV